MKNWKFHFAPHILERGLDYFDDDAVTKLVKTSEGYEATVEGSECYHVTIALASQQPVSMSCTCPYAERGENCKHMAAVLYAIEQEGNGVPISGGAAAADRDALSLQELIDALSEHELRRVLHDYAARDEALRHELFARYAPMPDSRTMLLLKREVDQAAAQCEDRHGYIDYDSAGEYETAMCQILEHRVSPLIERGAYMQALELSAYIFTQADSVDIDDSEGATAAILSACCDCWADILSLCSPQEKEQLYARLEALLDTGLMDYSEEVLSDFIMEHFDNRNFLLKKLKLVDEKLRQHDVNSDARADYELRWLLTERLSLMKDLQLPEKDIDAFTQRYYAQPCIRQYLIDCAMANNRIPDAIALLVESRQLDQGTRDADCYSEKLIDLYQAQHNTSAYLSELREYVLHTVQHQLTYVAKWKAAVSEKAWLSIREEILSAKCCAPIRLALLESEQLYDRLLQEVLATKALHTLERYEATLRPLYPTELFQAWKTHIALLAERASNRREYEVVMQYLRKLPQYPGGQEAAEQFARTWRTTYRRRSAMMDEMKKAGF
ncbi:MAG: SWIM zinc finger domain-containing protein [Aristaeellaceae bacterium]